MYLVLDGLVVSLLQPRAQYDGVVSVTERSQQRRGRVGRIVSQRKLSHELTKQRTKCTCTAYTAKMPATRSQVDLYNGGCCCSILIQSKIAPSIFSLITVLGQEKF